MTSALLLVDIQNDYFPGGAMELVGMTEASAKAEALLASFRAGKRPVFHVRHLSVEDDADFFIPGTPGAATHERVAPTPGEPVIEKNFPNGFRETNLEGMLKEAGVSELVIAGAMSHMCIDATTRAGCDLGFACTVVADACATADLEFDGRTVPARDVHASFMCALGQAYAEITTADRLLASSKS